MSKKMVVGVVAGIAIVSVASLMMSKNSKYNWNAICSAAGNVLDGIRDRISGSDSFDETDNGSARNGQYLARKAKQSAMHKFAAQDR